MSQKYLWGNLDSMQLDNPYSMGIQKKNEMDPSGRFFVSAHSIFYFEIGDPEQGLFCKRTICGWFHDICVPFLMQELQMVAHQHYYKPSNFCEKNKCGSKESIANFSKRRRQ